MQKALSLLSMIVVCMVSFVVPSRAADNPEIHPDRTVTFRLKAPKAETVILVGDWTKSDEQIAMKKGEDGVWTATAGPFPPGQHIYSFRVDDQLMPDPANHAIKLRSSGAGSFFHIDGDAPWELRNVPHGKVEINYFPSQVLGDTRACYVYTPPEYDNKPNQRFPVLYLLHGNNDTAAGWTMAGQANFLMDNLIADGKAKEMIVVMPYGHAVAYDSPAAVRRTNTEKFEAYLIEDIIPSIEKHYRVAADSEHRAIAGLSMGGGHSLTIAFNHVDLFSAVGAFSAAVPENFANQFSKALAAPQDINKRWKLLWIGCGKDDFLVARNRDLSTTLNEKQVRHVLRITDGVHNFEAWRRYLAEFAPQLFQ